MAAGAILGTLRFDDHRGLSPRDVILSEMGLQAKLTRSKVSGSQFPSGYHSFFGVCSSQGLAGSWMGSVAEGSPTGTRLPVTCAVEQLPRFQNQGVEVFDGLRCANTLFLRLVIGD